MAVTALAALLPMPSPIRVDSLSCDPVRYFGQRMDQSAHLTLRRSNMRDHRISYGDRGYRVLPNDKGRVIDLYA